LAKIRKHFSPIIPVLAVAPVDLTTLYQVIFTANASTQFINEREKFNASVRMKEDKLLS